MYKHFHLFSAICHLNFLKNSVHNTIRNLLPPHTQTTLLQIPIWTTHSSSLWTVWCPPWATPLSMFCMYSVGDKLQCSSSHATKKNRNFFVTWLWSGAPERRAAWSTLCVQSLVGWRSGGLEMLKCKERLFEPKNKKAERTFKACKWSPISSVQIFSLSNTNRRFCITYLLTWAVLHWILDPELFLTFSWSYIQITQTNMTWK